MRAPIFFLRIDLGGVICSLLESICFALSKLEVFMQRVAEWLGSIMFLIALIEFLPHPKKALEEITNVLSTNVRYEQGKLALTKPAPNHRHEAKEKFSRLSE
jgi:hypothetical protein